MSWLNNIIDKLDTKYSGCADPTVRSLLCDFERDILFALSNRAFRTALFVLSNKQMSKMEIIHESEFSSNDYEYSTYPHYSTYVKDGYEYFKFCEISETNYTATDDKEFDSYDFFICKIILELE